MISLNKKILSIISTTVGQLVFALLSGCAYFMIILRFIIDFSHGSALLGLFFAPVIICGAAIVLIKMMKSAREEKREGSIIVLFWLHVILFLMGIVFVLSII